LSLSQALVSSETLDETSISLLYRSLKPMIRTDQVIPRVQKRAYKVMAEICSRYKSFVIEDEVRLQELCELLTTSLMTSQISSRYMRLKCLSSIVASFHSSNALHMVGLRSMISLSKYCMVWYRS
jgi:ribosomal RNA-processing protein 12